MKKNNKFLMMMCGLAAFFVLLSLIVGYFPQVATPIAKAIGKPVETIQSWARTAFAVSVAVVFVVAGLMAVAASPILGVVLISAGVLTAGLALFGSSLTSPAEAE